MTTSSAPSRDADEGGAATNVPEDRMPRQRILWLSHFVPYPPKGGAAIRSFNLLKGVASHHDVDLVAVFRPEVMASYFGDAMTARVEAERVLGEFCSSVTFVEHREPAGKLRRGLSALKLILAGHCYTSHWLQSEAYAQAVRRALGDGDYDLVHVDTVSLSYCLDMLPSTIPRVLNHHNVESDMMRRRANMSGFLPARALLGWEATRLAAYEARQIPRYSRHLVCSELDGERLRSICPHDSVHVVPNGVAVPEDPPRRPVATRERRLVFIGGMGWYPNEDAVHHLLTAIWPEVARRFPSALLDIVGKSPSRRVQSVAARSDRVRLLGFVDDIAEVYETAAIFVCPIRDGGGTRLKLLDAAAHRVPIAAYEVACEGLGFTDGVHARVVSGRDELIDAIADLLQNETRATALAETAYQLVRDTFDGQKIGSELAGSYATAAASCHRGPAGG